MSDIWKCIDEGKKIPLSEVVNQRCPIATYIPADHVNFDDLLFTPIEYIVGCKKDLVKCMILFQPFKGCIGWADAILRVLYARYGEAKAIQAFLKLFGVENHPEALIMDEFGCLNITTHEYVIYPDGKKLVTTGDWYFEIPWISTKYFPSYAKEISNGDVIALN